MRPNPMIKILKHTDEAEFHEKLSRALLQWQCSCAQISKFLKLGDFILIDATRIYTGC
jgi:hypothetical protein